MRIVGALFIVVGVLLCLTLLFLMPGLVMVGVGALLIIAAGNDKAARLFRVRTPFILASVILVVFLVGMAWLGGVFNTPVRGTSPASASQQTSQQPSKAKKHHLTTASQGR